MSLIQIARQLVRTDDVIGVNVKNLQGEDIGEVKEIMLDKVSGEVEYVVLSYGGFLGMRDKLFALPWGVLNYDATDDCFKIPL